MKKEIFSSLICKAIEAREKSYAPYSEFAVGAALLTKDGSVYTGTNIENASFTPTVCAERVAFFAAVNDGKYEFVAIAIVGAKKGDSISEFCPPCGVCRQVMSEFCSPDFKIVLSDGKNIKVISLEEIMPCRFDLLD
jgi:cytidine deaminase